MKTWIITAIIVGIMIVATFGAVSFVKAAPQPEVQSASQCTSCGNSCNAESNCGLSTCGAAQGKSCGCGR